MIRKSLYPACGLAISLLSAGGASADVEDVLPLQPVRELRFETSEGTWMSLDVSPDGREIVFDLLGDIYAVSIDGGEASRLRGGTPFDGQPVYSPDGQSIAFVSDASGAENLWIANADGSEPKMLSGKVDTTLFSSPAWAADGDSVYVSQRLGRHGVFELWQYHVLGGEGIRIPADESELGESARSYVLGATASPDGRYLYLARKSTAAATLYSIPAWNIARRDLESGNVRPMVTALAGVFRPGLSPDGRWLSYGMRMDGETGLRIRDLSREDDRWIAYPVQRDDADAAFNRDLLPRYAFTPDSKALIVAYGGKIRRIELDTGQISVIPFRAKVDLGIGPSLIRNEPADSGPVRARIIQAPALSPDGRQLAFSAFARIYTAELPGGKVHALTGADVPAFHPAWSPDGRWISYVTWTAAEAGHVWRVRASGGKPDRLTANAAFYSAPAFSRDGKTIFALRSSNVERMRLQEEVTPRRFADLVRISVTDGTETVIVHTGIGTGHPYPNRDPERVFYTTPEGVKSVLATGTDGVGTDLRTHVRVEGLHPWTNEGNPSPVGEAKISPDGRWLLTTAASQLYLVALPPQSDETPVVKLTDAAQVPRIQVSRFGADYFAWADAGKTVTWSLGHTWFREPLESIEARIAARDTDTTQDRNVESIDIVVEIPRDIPDGSLLLRGASVITMVDEGLIEDAEILVENARITAVGSRGTIDVPDGARILELHGAYVVPGFVDTHAHWYEIRHEVLDLRNWSFLANLAFGVTSGLDVQAMDQDAFVYQDLLDAGLMVGPRAWTVGQGMFANNAVDSPQAADDLIRRYTEYYRTPNVKAYLIGNRQQRQWIVQSARRHHAIPTTEGNDDLKLDLTHAIDGFAGNEHQLPVVPVFDDVVKLFAMTGTSYTPTLMITSDGGTRAKDYFLVSDSPHDDPKVRRFMPHFVNDTRTSPVEWVRPDERMLSRVAESATKILRAGGRVGVGSHAEFQGVAYHWEMQALAAGGMTPREVLHAATDLGSRIIGRAEDIGTLEAGKFADLVVLNSNPLEDIRNTRDIRYVMKNGRLYDGDTLDELWPRQVTMLPLWHQEVMPSEATE